MCFSAKQAGICASDSSTVGQLRSRLDNNLIVHHSRDTPEKQWDDKRSVEFPQPVLRNARLTPFHAACCFWLHGAY